MFLLGLSQSYLLCFIGRRQVAVRAVFAPCGGRFPAGGAVGDQPGDQRDDALVDEGDDALRTPAGDDVIQAGTQAGGQEARARAKEQAAQHAQRVGHMQLRAHEQIVDEEDDGGHQADEADPEGLVAVVCHGEDFLPELDLYPHYSTNWHMVNSQFDFL